MKKNVMMRVASALLVAVLMTTCAISGTFAKYTTTAEGADTARVAKWGVTITGLSSSNAMFADSYTNGDSEVIVDADVKVVAPGTSGDFGTITISGDPEVAFKTTYEVTFELGDNWKVGAEEYCPIVFTVNGDDFQLGVGGIASINDLETAVIEAIEDLSKEYTTAQAVNETIEISWAWEFSTSDANDVKDTALGDAFNAEINFSIKCTVTQIDDLA